MIDEELAKRLDKIMRTQLEIESQLLDQRDAINALQAVLGAASGILQQVYEQSRVASAEANKKARAKLEANKRALDRNEPEPPPGPVN